MSVDDVLSVIGSAKRYGPQHITIEMVSGREIDIDTEVDKYFKVEHFRSADVLRVVFDAGSETFIDCQQIQTITT